MHSRPSSTAAVGGPPLYDSLAGQPAYEQTQFCQASKRNLPLVTSPRASHNGTKDALYLSTPPGLSRNLEPDRNFRLHAARRSHPKGLWVQVKQKLTKTVG